jgi:hypothetical protein
MTLCNSVYRILHVLDLGLWELLAE